MTTRLFDGTKSLGRTSLFQNVRLEVHQCGNCGVVWGIDEAYLNERRNDHKGWVCPNGHSFVFNGPSEEEQLRRQLDNERARSARLAHQRDQIEASRRATRGVVTKLKKRAAAGVCPCCTRTFQQLARHMESQHPDYVKTVEAG